MSHSSSIWNPIIYTSRTQNTYSNIKTAFKESHGETQKPVERKILLYCICCKKREKEKDSSPSIYNLVINILVSREILLFI